MADGTERESTLGTADSWGTVYTSGLYVAGDTVKATLTPIGDKAAGYLATTVTKTTDASSGGLSMSASIPAAIDVTRHRARGLHHLHGHLRQLLYLSVLHRRER